MSPAAGDAAPPRAARPAVAGAPVFSSPFPSGVAFCFLAAGAPATPPLLPAEQALLGGRASARRRADFARGRHCAREALARLGLPGARETPLMRGEGRAPRWPEGVVGSITHSGGMAAAAAARAEAYPGIGLDLERIGRSSPRVVARILRPAERAALEPLPPAAQAEAVALVFSAKEAIYKALNPATGVFLGFRDAELEALPPPGAEEGEFRWRLVRGCGAGYPPGFGAAGRFLRRGGYVLAAVWVERLPRP